MAGLGFGCTKTIAADEATDQALAKANRGAAPLKITKVRPILTAPQGIRLLVVKVGNQRARTCMAWVAAHFSNGP